MSSEGQAAGPGVEDLIAMEFGANADSVGDLPWDGYEGQGPEHSSARLERFRCLCAGGNMQVAACSSAAQYFHLLRRQAKQKGCKPLVVLTPKILLRDPKAGSPIEELAHGAFQPVICDANVAARRVERILMCSGKVYYDLAEYCSELGDERTAMLRLEQFYPVAAELIRERLSQSSGAVELRWVQEEPANMGGWPLLEPRLRSIVGPGFRLSSTTQLPSSSPATGSHSIHQMEQRKLVKKAFTFAA